MTAILILAGACSARSTDTAPTSPSAMTPDPAPTSAPKGSPPPAMTPDDARADLPVIHDNGCFAHHEDTAAPDPEDCSYGFFDGDTVVLYGDSHAEQWFAAAGEVAARHDWRLLPVTKADCPPGGERVLTPDLNTEYAECAEWHANAMALIETQEPILVLVAARSDAYRIIGEDGSPLGTAESSNRLGRALAEDLRMFADLGARTILIRDTQAPGLDVPDCIEAEGAHSCTYRLPDTEPDDAAQLAAAKATGSQIVDLRREVCGDRTDCRTTIDGLIAFRDSEHLTSAFGAALADSLEAGIESVPA